MNIEKGEKMRVIVVIAPVTVQDPLWSILSYRSQCCTAVGSLGGAID